MTKRYLPLLAWLAVAGLPSGALAQPVGPEFQVNTYTIDDQSFPSVASDASGNFVVVWQSWGQDGSRLGIFGQRYDSGGNPLGVEFRVNTVTSSDQEDARVTSDASGNFVVVWAHNDHYYIFGQQYDSDGNPLGEFQVNTYTYYESRPSVASDASGNFVLVWQSHGQDGSGYGILGQRYDSDANPLGGEFQVNTYTTDAQWFPAVASDASGNFVVVWEGFGRGDHGIGVFGQRYDSNGNPLGGEFQVNTYTPHRQRLTSVASDSGGSFVVVWSSQRQDGSGYGVFGQRYDSGGNPLGGEFQVNSHTTSSQVGASVASDASGNFVVVWHSYNQDPNSSIGVFGQRYDSSGDPLDGEFRVSTYTTNDQGSPSVASDASGNFVVVWNSNRQDGSLRSIFGQRFSAGCEASVQVQGGINTPGTIVPVQVHIAHHRPKTVTVRWALSLLDASGEVIAEHISPPHTFAPGDVLDQEVKFQLPDDLASGEYTLDLAVKRMAGTKGATTTLRVVRAE